MSLADTLALAVMITLAVISLIVLVAPAAIVLAISFDVREYVSFPPAGFTTKWYAALLDRRQIVQAFLTSLKVAGLVTLVCLALGVPAALAVVRGRFPGRQALGVFVMAPHALPGIVLGVAILFAAASMGTPASTTMLVVALSAFFLALVTRMTIAQLTGLDPTLERASLNLGAGRVQTFMRITLPQLLPALAAAAAFTFIEAFDNVSVAMFTHSYRERPLPVELLSLVETDNSPLVAAISSIEILLACLILLIGAATMGLERVSGTHR